MATKVYETDNFVMFEMRGAGVLVRDKRNGREVFFQPGDDAGTMRDIVEALREVPQTKQDTVFDVACSEYF